MGVDPISLALFAMTAASAVSSYSSQKKAANATEKSNALTMQAATEEAALTREDAADAAKQEKRDAARIRGQQIAAFMKSGVTLEGSPLLVTEETTAKGDRNAQTKIDNAESQARSILLRGEAGQQPVQKADLFGTAATVLGAGQTAAKSGAFGK